ncbi:hypothetical protein [Mediterranea massiliensis]
MGIKTILWGTLAAKLGKRPKMTSCPKV